MGGVIPGEFRFRIRAFIIVTAAFAILMSFVRAFTSAHAGDDSLFTALLGATLANLLWLPTRRGSNEHPLGLP
jgi:hypothetical protein